MVFSLFETRRCWSLAPQVALAAATAALYKGALGHSLQQLES